MSPTPPFPVRVTADGLGGRASGWWLDGRTSDSWDGAWSRVGGPPSPHDDGDDCQARAPSSSHTCDPGKDVCSLHIILAFPVGEFTSWLTCIVAPTSVPVASQGPVQRGRHGSCLMCTFAAAVEQASDSCLFQLSHCKGASLPRSTEDRGFYFCAFRWRCRRVKWPRMEC